MAGLSFFFLQEGEFAQSGYKSSYICLYPCPSPTFTQPEWDGMIAVTVLFNTVSFFCSFFLVNVPVCMALICNSPIGDDFISGVDIHFDASEETLSSRAFQLHCTFTPMLSHHLFAFFCLKKSNRELRACSALSRAFFSWPFEEESML